MRILFWMLIIQSAFGLVPAIAVWRSPPAELWPAILVISFTGMFSHYCMARALAHAETMVIMPMDFLRLPLAALVGWLLYGEEIRPLYRRGRVADPRRQPPQRAAPAFRPAAMAQP